MTCSEPVSKERLCADGEEDPPEEEAQDCRDSEYFSSKRHG